VAAVEDQDNQHGKPLADPEAAVEELGGIRSLSVEVHSPPAPKPFEIARAEVERPTYEIGEKVATRGAYGDALAWLGSVDEKVVALDGEVGNSTYAERFAAKHPERFFEMFIAEQQMVASAIGMQARGWKPFASSFGAFLSRAYDSSAWARSRPPTLKLCGSHVGVSIGPDGPSQMALEDIASLRAVLGSVVLYPPIRIRPWRCSTRCASTVASATCAAPGKRCRPSTSPGEEFQIGGSRTVRSGEDERDPDRRRHHPARMPRRRRGAGRQGHRARGRSTSTRSSRSTPRRSSPRRERPKALVTVEDHWPEGGIGETVAGVLAEAASTTPLVRLAVSGRPGSGPPADLLAAAGIDAEHIVAAVERALAAT
jgi:transketolase